MDIRRIIFDAVICSFAGTAGLLLVVGAAGAANANNPNVPTWSPLSINTNLGQTWYASRPPDDRGRAAYVKPMPQTDIFSDRSSDGNHNYPSDGTMSKAMSLAVSRLALLKIWATDNHIDA